MDLTLSELVAAAGALGGAALAYSKNAIAGVSKRARVLYTAAGAAVGAAAAALLAAVAEAVK